MTENKTKLKNRQLKIENQKQGKKHVPETDKMWNTFCSY